MQREEVICQIVAREEQGHALTETVILQEAPELHQAACRRFGAWETALHYAGVNVRQLSAKGEYRAEEAIRKLRALCRDGYNLKARQNALRDRQLYDAVRRHFGSWRLGLQAAGLNLRHVNSRSGPLRKYDRESTLESLREWVATGNSTCWMNVCLQNHDLAVAAKRACGSWRLAMLAIGHIPDADPGVTRRKWTVQRIIEAIRQRAREGKPLNHAAVSKDGHGLASAGRKYLGSWSNALAAAGVELQKYRRGRRGKPRP